MRIICLVWAALVCGVSPASAQEVAAPAVLTSGRVVDPAGIPVTGAIISVANGPTAVTDVRGRFEIEVPIDATLVIEATGFQIGLANVTGEVLDDLVLLRLADLVETIEIHGEAPLASAAPSAMAISRDEVRALPGARGDAIEAIRNLPGVAFATSGRGSTSDLAIRGTSGSDSWFLIDGIAVPAATHLGGLTAILPVDLIQSIDLHPGGFDVAYGRATGGVIELTTRPGRADRWHAAGDVSFVHASTYAEGPVWKDKVTVIGGVRRSFLDLVLPAVLPEDAGLSFTQAPVYTDAQLRLDARVAPRHQLTLFGLYSNDRFALLLDQGSANDPLFSGFSSSDRFWRVATTWRYDGSRVDVRTIAALGRDLETLALGSRHGFEARSIAATGRLDVRIEATKQFVVRTGVDAQTTGFDITGRVPIGGNEGAPDSNLTLDPVFELADRVIQPIVAGYLAADVRPSKRVTVTPGVRVERFGVIDDTVVAPRLAATISPADAWTLRGSFGRFSRAHDQVKMAARHLRAERSTQASIGVERLLGDGIRAGATAFTSWLDRLAVFDPILVTTDDPLAGYTSRGTGTARGLELLVQVRRDDLFGWIAYTFSQSRRVDAPGMPTRVFDQDQPHNAVAAGSWRRGRWRFGARFRFASGIPTTPVVGAVYVADHDVYRPTYGAANSQRLPATHQLDLRIDREIVWPTVKLSAYLDITNVYANPRVSGYAYDFDYRNRVELTELPLMPSIGMRGEL